MKGILAEKQIGCPISQQSIIFIHHDKNIFFPCLNFVTHYHILLEGQLQMGEFPFFYTTYNIYSHLLKVFKIYTMKRAK